MSTNDPLKNWQLENSEQNPDQWKLEDSEQDLNKHMQLEPAETNPYWQPVEYEREPKARRRNWVLPSILIVALLGVLGYVGWIAFNQFNSGAGLALPGVDVGGLLPGGEATPIVSPTPAAAVAGVAETPTAAPATPTVEPATATPAVAPTATPEPEPTVALAQLITGTVNSVAGVNARTEPATSGALVRLLNENEAVTVVQEQDGWLQVILADGATVAWASAEFITQGAPQTVPYEQVAALYTGAGLPLPTPISGTPAAVAAETAATTTTTVTAPVAAPVTLDVVVSGDPGINARETPAVDGVIVDRITLSSTVTAIGRTQAGDWLAVRLPSGQGGWVVANLVTAGGDITTLPVLEPVAIAPATTVTDSVAITGTGGITATGGITDTLVQTDTTGATRLVTNGVVPQAPFTNTLPAIGPALTVSDTTGINARPNPNTEGDPLLVVPNGAVLSIVGRNAGGDWYQVRLPDGRLAWMRADLISASSDAATAPVVEAGAAISLPVTATTTTTGTAATGTAATGPTLVATIDRDLGANFRSAPNRELDPVYNAQKGEAFTAVGRTNASDWVQLILPDGSLAWALAGTVVLDGDIATLAVTQP